MLKTVKKHMRIIKTCNLYLSYFTLGMLISLMGPCLLDLQHLVGTNTQYIALIYTARSIGYLVGAIFGGILLDIGKSKQAVLTGCNFFATVTMFGIPWCRNFETLMGFMVVNGLSLGAMETGGNVVCLQLWGKDSGPFFQAMHFNFGLGGLVSPLIAAPFLENSEDIPSPADNATSLEYAFNSTNATYSYGNINANGVARITYPFSIVGACGLLVTVMFLVVWVISPTDEGGSRADPVDENSNKRSSLSTFLGVLFTFLVVFVGIGTEIGFAQTLTAYAVKGRLHATPAVGSYMTSAFFAAFTISRLVSVFLSIKINGLVLIASDICIVALSALVLLFLMPSEWALWLASVLFGVGIGPFYAAVVGWVGTYMNVTNKVSAIITVGCAAGEMVGPFIITYFMESIPEMLTFVTATSSVVVSVLLFALYCIFRSGNDKSKGDKRLECYVISSSKEQGMS